MTILYTLLQINTTGSLGEGWQALRAAENPLSDAINGPGNTRKDGGGGNRSAERVSDIYYLISNLWRHPAPPEGGSRNFHRKKDEKHRICGA